MRGALEERVRRTARFYRTARHLTIGQMYWRLRYRLPIRPGVWEQVQPRRAVGAWVDPIVRECRVDALGQRASFMNQTRFVASGASWNDPGAAKLWLYHLHYFEDVGGKFRVQGEAAARAWISRWIAENPRHAGGNGWEPYPTSRRIVSWIKAALDGMFLDEQMLRSLAWQAATVEARLERHILANHLFVNAKALVYAGVFLHGPESEPCLERGVRLVVEQLERQVQVDGGHYERSPMYHASFVEDVLDLINVCRTYVDVALAARLESDLLRTVVPMLDWLVCLTRPDGQYARFNDTTGGEVPDTAAILAYASRLGLSPCETRGRGARHLPASGFARLERDSWTVFADVGDVGPSCQPGHAHAATLSVEIHDGDRCLVCGSGVSTYEIGPVRDFERSTPAHCAVSVDGEDSSETWAGFRVGRRARVHDAVAGDEDNVSFLQGWHDGYRHLPGNPEVHRRVEVGSSGVRIRDRVLGKKVHSAAGWFPLHPLLSVLELGSGRAVLAYAGVARYELRFEDSAATFECHEGWFSPEFGLRQPRCVLSWHCEGVLPIGYTILLRRL